MKREAGFTLIEIMLVVGVIGVLANLVLPTMRLDAKRARMTEVMQAFTPCRTAIAELRLVGEPSPGADEWGCETENPSKYVARVRTTGEGIILVDVGGMGDLALDHHTVSMEPLTSAGDVVGDGDTIHRWRCGAPPLTDVAPKYLPSACQGQ